MSWNTAGYQPPNEQGGSMNPAGLLPEGQGNGLAQQEGDRYVVSLLMEP